jgi:hypothetical protein
MALSQLAARVARLERGATAHERACPPAAATVTDTEQTIATETLPAAPARVLEERFEEESADPGWSSAQERALREALGTPPEGSELEDIECATSLCRVLLRHESLDAQQLFAATASSAESLEADVFFDYETESSPPATILYLVRRQESARD